MVQVIYLDHTDHMIIHPHFMFICDLFTVTTPMITTAWGVSH